MSNPRLWGPIEIVGGPAQFVQTVRNELNRINHGSIGREVFRRLEGSGCLIEFTPGKLETSDNDAGSTSFWGPNRPIIKYDPSYALTHDFEPTTLRVRHRGMTWIYLFHELVHCLNISESYSSPIDSPEDEFRTTGLYRYATERISENSFRRQAGLPRRPVYNWVGSSPTLATEQRLRLDSGLSADPQNYLRNVEDDFASWDNWFPTMVFRRNTMRGLHGGHR